MNITREDLPGRQIALTIELEPTTINEALDRAYRQMVNRVNVPGFRRGKAPRYILESYVGKEALTEKAVNNILPQTVKDAIAEQNIEAMDVGDVEIISMDPVRVKVVVVQPPEVELGDYSSIRIEKEPVEITPEQVDEVVAELRRDGAPWNEPAEPRPIKEGDMVYLDLEAFTTEGPLAEAERDNFPTIVGVEYGGVPQAVNSALEGMLVGEERDIADTLPEDYPVEEMRGRDITYHLTVRSMKEQQLPELNDDFAKTLSYDTVDALREAAERNLHQRAEEAARNNQVNKIIAAMVEGSSVEAPDIMVKEELDAMLKNLEERLKRLRLTTRQYFMYNGVSEQEWRETNRDKALERLVRGLVLQEFARREGISVDEDEVNKEISQLMQSFEGNEQEREKAEELLGRHEMRHDLEDQLFQSKIEQRLIAIAEGRAEDKAQATDLENTAGAAELEGTGEVDLSSPNETGEAAGGGTPETAPSLEAEREA